MRRLVVVALLLLVASTACAEIYTWKDARGTVFYTNSLHEIPARFLSRARLLDVATGKKSPIAPLPAGGQAAPGPTPGLAAPAQASARPAPSPAPSSPGANVPAARAAGGAEPQPRLSRAQRRAHPRQQSAGSQEE